MRQHAAFPPPALAGSEPMNTDPLFPPGSKSLGRPSSSCASASLNATVYLLNQYQKRSPPPTKLSKESEYFLRVQPLLSDPSTLSVMAGKNKTPSPRRRLCFVTVGATAPFDSLIDACRTPEFVASLESAGFTNLLLQHGHRERKEEAEQVGGIRITSFDFRKDGIAGEMLAANGKMQKLKDSVRVAKKQGNEQSIPGLDFGDEWQDATWEEGVVISHAGSGSILDALRISVPLIVVPNEKLLDNHQVELAEALADQGYVTHGHLTELSTAIEEVEKLRQKRKTWPPPVDESVDPGGKGLIGVMDEEMGYRDLKGSNLSRPGDLHLD